MRIVFVIATCALGGLCAAQTTTSHKTDMFVTMELGSARVVKGAPYSAKSISEFEQQLTDGNRIFRSNSGMVCRDSEGRTRREQAGGIDLLGTSTTLPTLIIITDPVAGFRYTLNPTDKTAIKTSLPPEGPEHAVMVRATGELAATATVHAAQPSAGAVIMHSGGGVMRPRPTRPATAGPIPVEAGGNFTTESLGTRPFDGVVAEGTRTVTTIAAGLIGNERPIDAVKENWFSQQLQVTVFSRYNDPRTGTTTERLTGISLAEPPPSLFEIPADYTLREGASNWIMVKPTQK